MRRTFSGSEDDLSHDSDTERVKQQRRRLREERLSRQQQQALTDKQLHAAHSLVYGYHQVAVVTEEQEEQEEEQETEGTSLLATHIQCEGGANGMRSDLGDESERDLLPVSRASSTQSIVSASVTPSSSNQISASSLHFRLFLLSVLSLQASATALTMRYSRGLLQEPYSVISTIILIEALKLILSVLVIVHLSSWSLVFAAQRLLLDIRMSLPLSVPAFLYLIQNQLGYVGLQLLDSGTFSALSQLKLLTTALFAVVLLRRHVSANQWRALLVLFIGVVVLQTRPTNSVSLSEVPISWFDRRFGELSVLGIAALSGAAGIYFELVLKGDNTMDMWDRNVQLSLYGIIFSFVSIPLLPHSQLVSYDSHPFFYGWSYITVLIVVLSSLGGLLVAAAVAYTDNILKNFASSVSIVITSIVSYLYFHDLQFDVHFACGAAAIIVAIFSYNYDAETEVKAQTATLDRDLKAHVQNSGKYEFYSHSLIGQQDPSSDRSFIPRRLDRDRDAAQRSKSTYCGCLHLVTFTIMLLLAAVVSLSLISYGVLLTLPQQISLHSVMVGILSVPLPMTVSSSSGQQRVDIVSSWVAAAAAAVNQSASGGGGPSPLLIREATPIDDMGHGLQWAELLSLSAMYTRYPDAAWYYKSADDALVSIPRLAQLAANKAFNTSQLFYIGLPVSSSSVSHNWCAGDAGYLISNGLMRLLHSLAGNDTAALATSCCADKYVGKLASLFNVRCVPHPAVFDYSIQDYVPLVSSYTQYSIPFTWPHTAYPDVAKFPTRPNLQRGSLAPNFNWNGHCGVDNFKCVISFGLYGNHPRFTVGAVKNVQLIHFVYPGWVARFYLDHSVPQPVIDTLVENKAELVFMDNSTDHGGSTAGMFWRFLVAVDPTVDRFLIRDVDSRLTHREAAAVQEWIESGFSIHHMRDHPAHIKTMLGGLWGGVKGALRGIDKEIASASRNGYDADQQLLERFAWPLVQWDQISHASYNCEHLSNSYSFPTPRPWPTSYVGGIYDEKNENIIDTGPIESSDAPPACRRHCTWTKG